MDERAVWQDVADVMVWLDHATTQELLRMLLQDERGRVFARLRQLAPELDPSRADDPVFFARLLDELELRVAPADDLDDLETREMPDLSRFARPQATDERPRRK